MNQEFLDKYCNWNGLKTIFLTFDIDWAPDYMIENVVKILSEFPEIKATFFITHYEQILQEIYKKYEIGSHINLGNKHSSEYFEKAKEYFDYQHGRDILKYTGNRFHKLNYSYGDLIKLKNLNYLYDASNLRFGCEYLIPNLMIETELVLIPYFWEDGIHENIKTRNIYWSRNNIWEGKGLRVLNFHPLNLYLNNSDSGLRVQFLKDIKDCNINLLDCPKELADQYVNNESVTHKMCDNFKEWLQKIRDEKINTYTLGELAKAFKESI